MKYFIQLTTAALALIACTGADAQQRGYLELDGATEAKTITAGPDLSSKSFTIEFWVKRDRTGVYEWVLGQGQEANNNGLTIGFYPNGNFVFSFWNNNLNYFETYLNRADTWNHYACVYDYNPSSGKGTRNVYHNGNPTPAKIETDIFPYNGNGQLHFGDRPQTPGSAIPFQGNVDEMRIWGRALSGEEIQSRFERELNDTERADPDLLAYYPFNDISDEGVGVAGANDLADLSGNNLHADVFAGAATVEQFQPTYDPSRSPIVTEVVTNTDSNGEGSLSGAMDRMRAAANKAKALGSTTEQNYLIDCTGIGGTITLTTPLNARFMNLTINGPGENILTIDGGASLRPFHVSNGSTIVLRDLSVKNGNTVGASEDGAGSGPGLGGAVLVEANCHLLAERVTFENNQAIGGAATIGVDAVTAQARGGLGGNGQTSPSDPNYATNGNGKDAPDSGALGGIRGLASGADGQPGGHGSTGGNGNRFGGGARGTSGAGGGGGAYFSSRGGDGGSGGNGGTGGQGGYGAGGGAGGNGGGGGGAGDGGHTQFGTPGAGGIGGTGPGGFGGGDGYGQDANDGSALPVSFGGPGGVWAGYGAGAGMGGAIFVETHGTMELNDVFFYNNHARGGAGDESKNNDGHGIGGAAHVMPGGKLVTTRNVDFFQNRATTEDGTTNDPLSPNSLPVYGVPQNVAGAIAQSLYYFPAELAGIDPGSAAFRYRWMLYSLDTDDAVKFEYTIDAPSAGVPQDPDPSELFSSIDRANAFAARNQLEQLLDAGSIDDNPEAKNLLINICYDIATFDGFLAGFHASQIERDARIFDPAINSANDHSLDEHIAAYDGILQEYRDAVACYQRIFADPQLYDVFIELLPLRDNRPLIASVSPPVFVGDPTSSGFADLTLLFDLLSQYGDAAQRQAELYLKRDESGDRDLGLTVAESAARYLHSASLTLIPLVPESGAPSYLIEAVAKWEARASQLTDIQSHHLSGINSLGFPDDFLLLVGAGNADSFDTLRPRVETYVEDAVTELNDALESFATYGANQDTYKLKLDELLTDIDDRLSDIGDENSGLILEQISKIENAQLKIRSNRVKIDNIQGAIDIEMEKNETLKANNTKRADIRVEYLDKHRALDEEIATIETAQKGADFVAGLAEPSDPLTKLQKFARVTNFLFQAGAEVAKADLEKRKHELAGAEIQDISHVDNLDLDAGFRAFAKTKLLDLKRLAVESEIAANVLRREMNKAADLVAEAERLQSRRDALTAPANSTVDSAIAKRYFANPIHQLRVEDSTSRADATFKKAQLWMFILMRSLEYKWNQDFTQEDNDETYTATSIFRAHNARDLSDIVSAMEVFDSNRVLDFQGGLQTSSSVLSLREDIFGYVSGKQHRDPLSGELTDAISAFRSKLIQLRGESLGKNSITVPFHTVRTLPNDNFFRGVDYIESGGNYIVDRVGIALNKINWVKLHIHGPVSNSFTHLSSNSIRYGGTTFVRRIRVGRIDDPNRPDRIVDELVPYETRNYLLSAGTFPPEDYSNNIHDPSVEALVTGNSADAPGSIAGDHDGFVTNKFSDRSVAATEWEVVLRVGEPDNADGEVVLPLEQVDDVEVIINHRSTDRLEN